MASEHGYNRCILLMKEIDGGATVLQAKVPIFPGDTVEEVNFVHVNRNIMLSFGD